MGFGSNSRKQAQQQQLQAMQQQQQAFQNAQAQAQQYQSNFNTRNAGILGLQTSAQNWLRRYEKGADVASLNPAFVKNAQETADSVQKTMMVANRLGNNAMVKGDAGYQNKLNSVASRNIAKGLAQLNEQGLMSELDNQRGILMDTSNFLNADSRAGLSLNSELFSMTNSLFNNATTRRQMEIQRSNMMMGNFMQFLSGGISTGLQLATGGLFGGGSGSASSASSGNY